MIRLVCRRRRRFLPRGAGGRGGARRRTAAAALCWRCAAVRARLTPADAANEAARQAAWLGAILRGLLHARSGAQGAARQCAPAPQQRLGERRHPRRGCIPSAAFISRCYACYPTSTGGFYRFNGCSRANCSYGGGVRCGRRAAARPHGPPPPSSGVRMMPAPRSCIWCSPWRRLRPRRPSFTRWLPQNRNQLMLFVFACI